MLFFYEQRCPRCAGMVPGFNKTVQKYRDQPVQFIAIAAGDSAAEAEAYVRRTGLDMPVFVDRLSLMENRYKVSISMKHIYQFYVIGPDGRIAGYSNDETIINQALANIESDFNAADYHDKLGRIVTALNAGEIAAGLRQLKRHLKDRDPDIQASATRLQDDALALARRWMEQADGLAESDPFTAGHLYARVAEAFPTESFGRDARTRAGELRRDERVKQEISARKMYARLAGAVEKADPSHIKDLAAFARQIAEKYPDTPTGRLCDEFATDLGN